MDAKQAKQLRDPFPAEVIGKLPKGGVMLDFVGHAATTDRLLQVDPGWTWEPMALTPEGLPALDRSGNLWIRLTVCGVTRPGVGDGKNAKECIGDAIRNAAMRFGVALDLWAKEDLTVLHAGLPSEGEPQAAGADGPIPVSAPEGRSDQAPSPSEGNPPSEPMKRKLNVLVGTLRTAGHITTEQLWMAVRGTCPADPHWSDLREELTKPEAHELIERLTALEARVKEPATA